MILDGNCLYLNCRERPPCRSAGCPHATTAPRRIRTEFPNPLPRGEGGPKGRVRNAGGNMKVSKKRTDLHPSRSSGGGLQIFIIVRLPPAFLISHQSVPKSRLVTASPRGKRLVLPHQCFCLWCGCGHPGRGGPTVSPVGNAVPGVPQTARKRPPHPGESGPPSHFLCHCEGRRPVAISCEIVQILTMYQEIATSLRSSQ